MITLVFCSLLVSPIWWHFSFVCVSSSCTCEVVFYNKAMPSAKPRSVSTFAGCLRYLCGCRVRPSSFSPVDNNPMSILKNHYAQEWSKRVLLVHTCCQLKFIRRSICSNNSCSSIGQYINLMAISAFSRITYAWARILNILFYWIESNTFLKSKNVIL